MLRVSILFVTVAFLITEALIAGMAGCDGTTTVRIRTWYDLDAVRNNLGGNYTLMNDLDSATPGYTELASPTANGGKGWQPIGNEEHSFTGIFDGQGYEIRDVHINRPDEYLVGLFGCVYEQGVIENVGVVDAIITGNMGVGGLAGGNMGNVANCYATGSVAGDDFTGGLVGLSVGNMSYCYFNGSVNGNAHIGCLVGIIGYAVVSNSYSTGSAVGGVIVDGLVGFNDRGSVSNSYSTSSAIGVANVGGLVGVNAGNVSESYSTGNVTGNSSVGGLVGRNIGTVSDSFWDTLTSGQATSAGGMGKNTVEMKDIATFSGAHWSIIAVDLGKTNPAHIWNIVNNVTYPFLSWQA